jgi:signal transduction histidine kinase
MRQFNGRKIDIAYKSFKIQNRQLVFMDKFKSNLIDTVSHEFRLLLHVLKDILQLLRRNINLDEQTRIKS